MKIAWAVWADKLISSDLDHEPGFVWCKFRTRFYDEIAQVRFTPAEFERLQTVGCVEL
jgi:hypothetical protein